MTVSEGVLHYGVTRIYRAMFLHDSHPRLDQRNTTFYSPDWQKMRVSQQALYRPTRGLRKGVNLFKKANVTYQAVAEAHGFPLKFPLDL